MKWQAVPLETVAEIQLGKMLSGKASKGVSPAPYLRNANVQWGRLMLDDLLEMDFSQTEREKFSLKQGDLIVCEGGEPGRCAVVTEPLQNIFFQKALMRVRPRTDRLTPKFLQRFMQHAASRGVFRQGGNQSTIAHFPAVRLRALAVPLPPLPEQKRIAAILDAADALRAKRRESIEQLDSLVQATFLGMFGDPAKNRNRWEMKACDDICTKVTDGEHGSVNRLPSGRLYLMARNVTASGQIDLGDVSFVSEADHRRIFQRCNPEQGDLLLVCVGATIGKTAIVPHMAEFSLARSVALLKPCRNLVQPAYLNQYLRSRHGQTQLLHGRNTAAQAGLYLGKIKAMSIPLPPLDLQTRFATIVESIELQKARLKAHLAELDTLFASLQSRAFNGELVA